MKRKHWTNRALLKTTLQVTKPLILAFLLNFWLFWREIDLSSLELKKSKDKIEEMPKSWKEGFVKAKKEEEKTETFLLRDFFSKVVNTSVSQCHIYPLEGKVFVNISHLLNKVKLWPTLEQLLLRAIFAYVMFKITCFYFAEKNCQMNWGLYCVSTWLLAFWRKICNAEFLELLSHFRNQTESYLDLDNCFQTLKRKVM